MIDTKSEINHFIFVCSDSEDIDGIKHSAFDVTKLRLSKKMWPIYPRTKYRKQINKNDICLFYLAGKMESRQCFVAKATVVDINEYDENKNIVDSEDLLTRIPDKIVKLDSIIEFPPLSIRPLLCDFSFVDTSLQTWGGAFQGGCKLISFDDYNLVVNKITL